MAGVTKRNQIRNKANKRTDVKKELSLGDIVFSSSLVI